MSFYMNIIELIFIFLTAYLTQTITALDRDELLCCITLDDYCSAEQPLDSYNEDAVNKNQQPSPALLQRWEHLTAHDCAKAEILKWKSDPDAPIDVSRFRDYMDYRYGILIDMEFGDFRLPKQFCTDHGFKDEKEVDICYDNLRQTFGDTLEDIHTYAVEKITLAEVEDKPLHAKYLQEIASKTNVMDGTGIKNPFQYCTDEDPDDQNSFTGENLDEPFFSESTFILND